MREGIMTPCCFSEEITRQWFLVIAQRVAIAEVCRRCPATSTVMSVKTPLYSLMLKMQKTLK